MVDATHTSYAAGDRSYFSLLKKDIHSKALQAGFNVQKLGEIDIVVAELTSNLHKYAKDGEILVSFGTDHHGDYIELITIDNGPGMAEPAKMMQDGYSTGTTMGHGFGSIKRMSDAFDLYSIKGWGTIVLSRIYQQEPKKPQPGRFHIEVKALVVAKTGQHTSGDGFYQQPDKRYLKLLVADGLGHGPEANAAVNAAVNSFQTINSESPVDILRHLHADIRKTRGMVGMVAILDLEDRKLQIAGIGNISAKFFSPAGQIKTHVSYNGIIGHNIPNTISAQEISFGEYSMLIFCSDGIKSRWDLSKYTGITKCDPIVLSAALYKDFSRRTDDTSVIVVKFR